MWYWAATLFAFQSLAMLLDEMYFHRQRSLPLWERIGHPLDTFTVLLCLCVTLFLPYSLGNEVLYAGCAAFSTLFITKDEWVHARLCGGGESWLHGLLFVVHPVLLALVWFHWALHGGSAWAALPGEFAFTGGEFFRTFLRVQTAMVGAFMVYQILYWNLPRKSRIKEKKSRNENMQEEKLWEQKPLLPR